LLGESDIDLLRHLPGAADVCRACQPSDDACRMARAKFGLRYCLSFPLLTRSDGKHGAPPAAAALWEERVNVLSSGMLFHKVTAITRP
jgi:hypothetical protein